MLNQPFRLFGLLLDEAILLIIPIAVGFIFSHYITGLVVGGGLMYCLKTMKRGKPSSYLYNSIYWFLPKFVRGGMFKKIPPSYLRHWIK
jgi:type IV conjugative transfer system protein TraL